MLHRVRSLVTVLALGMPALAAADRAQPPPNPTSTFLKQTKYTYCDAKILASLWKQSVGDAKARVGMKLQSGSTAYLDTQVTAARNNALKIKTARCAFYETGFSYDDALKLSKMWNLSVEKAKATIEEKVAGYGEKYVSDILAAPAPAGNDAALSAFLKQDKYTYCDVKLLSAMWKSSEEDAKTRIGMKLQNKNEKYLESELATSRKGTKVHCDYSDAGLTFDDVERLAKVWKTTVDKAKATIEKKAIAGQSADLRKLATVQPPTRMVPPPIKPPPPATKTPAPATKTAPPPAAPPPATKKG